MFFDKVEKIINPEEIIVNDEYLKIFNFLKKNLKTLLIHKGYITGESGRSFPCQNISIGYKQAFVNGKIKSRIGIIE